MTLKQKKLFLLDLDGTIYVDGNLVPGALDFLRKIRQQNADYVFLTNNSSKSTYQYIEKLNALNIPCKLKNIFSSTNYTVRYLKEKNIERIYFVGTESVKEELSLEGITTLAESDTTRCDAVLVGFDTELNYEKLRVACDHLFNGALFLATNPDMNCPMPNRRAIPDCGAICDMLKAATKKDAIFLGKPNPDMITCLLKERGISASEAVVIGDRLYTDVAIGLNAGVDSIAVLTGETTENEIEMSKLKPTYIFSSVSDILT